MTETTNVPRATPVIAKHVRQQLQRRALSQPMVRGGNLPDANVARLRGGLTVALTASGGEL